MCHTKLCSMQISLKDDILVNNVNVNKVIKGSSHSKKKSVNFHTFGPDPPP